MLQDLVDACGQDLKRAGPSGVRSRVSIRVFRTSSARQPGDRERRINDMSSTTNPSNTQALTAGITDNRGPDKGPCHLRRGAGHRRRRRPLPPALPGGRLALRNSTAGCRVLAEARAAGTRRTRPTISHRPAAPATGDRELTRCVLKVSSEAARALVRDENSGRSTCCAPAAKRHSSKHQRPHTRVSSARQRRRRPTSSQSLAKHQCQRDGAGGCFWATT